MSTAATSKSNGENDSGNNAVKSLEAHGNSALQAQSKPSENAESEVPYVSIQERYRQRYEADKLYLTAGAKRIYGRTLTYEVHRPSIVDACKGILIKRIHCGEDHVVLQDAAGKLWSWGRGETGQLGLSEKRHAAFPKVIKTLEPQMLGQRSRVIDYSCGSNFCAAVTDGGQLYTWGGNASGQLGQGDAKSGEFPRVVVAMHRKHVHQVACGGAHTIVLTTARDVFTWGRNTHGQLGLGAGRKCTSGPRRRVMGGLDVKQIAAGENHSAVLTSSGDIYTWGRGDYGQLGLGDFTSKDVPTLLSALDQRAQVAQKPSKSCGFLRTYSEHCLCL